MTVEYKDAIQGYLRKYRKTFEIKLGLTEDDIKAEIREQIWKGLATFDPSKRANKRTYLNNVVKNRMGVLLTRSKIKKNSSLDYCADVWSNPGVSIESTTDETTPESIFEQRELLAKINYYLSDFDRQVNLDLLEGRSLEEMEQIHRKPRPEIIGSIKRIVALKQYLTR
jgi:hypothetical protein